MKIVVPLAGPDFVLPDGSVKAELSVGGTPLLRRALESRSWWRNSSATSSDLTFVLLEGTASRRFAADTLPSWYPGARTVFLSTVTHGAALSALAGAALVAHGEEFLCLDLADILFTDNGDAFSALAAPRTGGVALTFGASDPAYSFLRRDDTGRVVEAAEKRVISNEASAGVYLFRSPAVYLRAVAHALENRESQTYRRLFFVCPLINGVLAQGLNVVGLPVTDVRDIKMTSSAS